MNDRVEYQDNPAITTTLNHVRLDEVNRLIESIGREIVEINAESDEVGVLLGILQARRAELAESLGLI